MEVKPQHKPEFPTHFGGIILRSLKSYRDHFLNYLLLAVITYLPFLVIIQLSHFDLIDIVEFFHGHFLDIIVFLTLPTMLMEKRVFPFATIALFFQRFFASAVVLCFIQLGTLLFFVTFFAQIGLGVILIGVIPYIFLLFAGYYLIMENSERLLSIRPNLKGSIQLVRSRFFTVFWNYFNITIFMFLPLFFFSLWYFSRHDEMLVIRDTLAQATESDLILGQRFIEIIQNIVQETGFKWSRIGIHIGFRPLKSLFLSFLFLSLLQHLTPAAIQGFLGKNREEGSETADPTQTTAGNQAADDTTTPR